MKLLLSLLAVVQVTNCALYKHEEPIPIDVASANVLNLDAKLRYVGRYIFNLTVIPTWGCIAVGSIPNPETSITLEAAQEYGLICPLFANHSASSSAYKITIEQFSSNSSIAETIQGDILTAGKGFFVSNHTVENGILITWEGATQTNGNESEKNTYQVAVVVTSKISEGERSDNTFVVFNYDQIQWTGWTDRTEESFAGFIYGDNKGSSSLPFTLNSTQILTLLAKKSTLIGTAGRYIYDVTDVPQRIGCLDFSDVDTSLDRTEPLTVSTSTADIFGGKIVRVQGQCGSTVLASRTFCAFNERLESRGWWWRNTTTIFINNYTAICVSPPIDLGTTQVGMTINRYTNVRFRHDFYIGAPVAQKVLIKLTSANQLLEESPTKSFKISWDPAIFEPLTEKSLLLSIRAYKMINSAIVSKTFQLTSVVGSLGEATIDPTEFQCGIELPNEDCNEYFMGQFVLTPSQIFPKDYISGVTRVNISSLIVPIGWFVSKYHRIMHGAKWYARFCEPQQSNLLRQTCPCREEVARSDTRKFAPAPDCTYETGFEGQCLLQGDESTYCYSSFPEGPGGTRCCYDTDGNLIYGEDNPMSGSYKLEVAPLTNFMQFGYNNTRTYLSYSLTHVKNFFACCTAAGLGGAYSGNCSRFASAAQVDSQCAAHTTSLVSAIAGDPHFILPDNKTYTFNGVGEYWYAFSSDEQLAKIQVRFSRANSRYSSDSFRLNATIISAVALRVQNQTVQIQVQPGSYLDDPAANTKRLSILVNGREETWQNDELVRFYDRFRIASSGENQGLFHVTLLGDGAHVACQYTETVDNELPVSPGSMNCIVSYSKEQLNELAGLIGRKLNSGFELVKREDWNAANPTTANLTDLSEVHTFGRTWLVDKAESLFKYVGTSYETVNSEADSLTQIFEWKPSFINGNETDVEEACSTIDGDFWAQCEFDFRVTGSRILARRTATHLEYASGLNKVLSAEQKFCPALEMPFVVKTLSSGLQPGSVANVTGCVPRYAVRSEVKFPFTLTCTQTAGSDQYSWLPADQAAVACASSVLYDTSDAVQLADPYENAPVDLNITDLVGFPGRRLQGIKVNVPLGCLVLSTIADKGDEPMICPLVADHATKRPAEGVADPFKFLFQTVNETTASTVLSEITEDITEVARTFDSSVQSDFAIFKAHVFTWLKATHNQANCSTSAACESQPRNTYQIVVALGYNKKTYVIFNYAAIEWSGLSSPGDNPTNNSFAGFYYGDHKGNTQLPYSGRTTSEIKKLLQLGTQYNTNGRYIFEVSSAPHPIRLGCYPVSAYLPRSVETLSISKDAADIYGGHVIKVQGVCMTDPSAVRCSFERRSASGSTWFFTAVIADDTYTALCATPRTPSIDVGWTKVGLSFDSGNSYKYVNDFYFGTTKSGGSEYPLSVSSGSHFWLRANLSERVLITWEAETSFGLSPLENPQVELLMIGFNSTSNLGYVLSTVVSVSAFDNLIILEPETIQCTDDNCDGLILGQFVLRITPSALPGIYRRSEVKRISISSPMMPIAWFTNAYNTGKYGSKWYERFCKPAFSTENAGAVQECPCTQQLAEADERVFFEAPDCLAAPESSEGSCMYSPGAKKCVTTLPIFGRSIRCCYDNNGYLIQSENAILRGSYALPVAVDSNFQALNISDAFTQLSFLQSHVKDYLTCCSVSMLQANETTSYAYSFGYKRAISKSCSTRQFSVWSGVIGDPHFVTADGTKYTFNGLGEYWYLHTNQPSFASIQVRLAKAPLPNNAYTNATVLTAVAIKFRGSKVEVHLQPLSFRLGGNKYLMILVDGKEYSSNSFSEMLFGTFKMALTSQHSSVTINFVDDGPRIACSFVQDETLTNYGGINCRVSLPTSYQRASFGLSGFFDGDQTNDLVARDKISSVSPVFVDSSNTTAVHKDFALSWNVKESESLFTYLGESWQTINQDWDTYIPELKLPPNYESTQNSSVNDACGFGSNRARCQYDLELTGSRNLARQTALDLDAIDKLRASTSSTGKATCDTLDVPYAVISYPRGYDVGSEATVSGCFPGYLASSNLPVTYECQQISDSKPFWSPAPSALCRASSIIYSDSPDAVVIDPYNPELPPIVLPAGSSRNTLPSSLNFGGRRVFGLSVIASRGCIAFRENVTSEAFESAAGLPLSEKDLPLLCPLFATFATDRPNVADPYEIRFRQIQQPDPILTEIAYDIKAASAGLDQSLDNVKFTNAYTLAWKDARSSTSRCNNAANCDAAPRNTFEILLAVTNEESTYAIFNYKEIKWSGLFYPNESWYSNSFAALNYGDSKGFKALPFSYMNTTSLANLASSGTLRDYPGRFIYRVSDRFERIGCLDLPADYPSSDTQSITINSYVADIFGNRRLALQSACPPANVDGWLCGFRLRGLTTWSVTARVYRMNNYTVVCKPPQLPALDVGEWAIGVSTNNGSQWMYEETVYLAGTVQDTMPLQLTDNVLWYSAKPAKPLRLEWSPAWFNNENYQADVLLVAYKQNSTTSQTVRREFTVGSVNVRDGAFEIDPAKVNCSSSCEDFLVGQVAIRLRDESAWWQNEYLNYAEIASSVVTIGWFVDSYHANIKGPQWFYDYCDSEVVTVAQQCPCSSTVAEVDSRMFLLAPNCNDIYNTDCMASPQSEKCFVTMPLNTSGAGLLCCYDISDNLVYAQNKPFGGSFALKYAPVASMRLFGLTESVSFLSYYFSHAKNLFACCSANVTLIESGQCFDFVESRSVSKDCGNYEISGLSTVVGDPHILTPDSTIYTFNGVGEYWWVFGSSPSSRALRIQVRFQNNFKYNILQDKGTTIRATMLTAIAIKFDLTKIHVEVQAPSYLLGGGRRLSIWVNDYEKFFYEYPSVQYFGGARVYSSARQNFFTINTPYNGPSIECQFVDLASNYEIGSLSCHVYLPATYKSNSFGLSGKWDGIPANDLVPRPNITHNDSFTKPTDMSDVHVFGKTWRVAQNESYFTYIASTFELINRDIDTFVPEFSLRPASYLNRSMIDDACGGSARQFSDRCEYDYRITYSKLLSINTGEALRNNYAIQQYLARENKGFCSYLDIPYSIVSFTQGVRLNSVASFYRCIEGYVPEAGLSLPMTFRCQVVNGRNEWLPTPTPMKYACKLLPATSPTPAATQTQSTSALTQTQTNMVSTSTDAASTRFTQSATATSTASSSAQPFSEDHTLEIVFGVILGVTVLVVVILIAYYCVSIKPKLSTKNNQIASANQQHNHNNQDVEQTAFSKATTQSNVKIAPAPQVANIQEDTFL